MTLLAEDRLPASVRGLLSQAQCGGAPMWIVGGAVRDALLDRRSEDLDLGSAWTAAAIAAWLDPRAKVDVDPTLGTCTWSDGGCEIVHTTLREESDYGPERRPNRVTFIADPEADSRRRDFTCNALYLDPLTDTLLDFHDGRKAIALRHLVTIGDPRERFAQDPLRILRAARFEASHGLRPVARCAAAMAECAEGTRDLVPQRRFGELHRLLAAKAARAGVERLLDTAVLARALPALAGQEWAIRSRLDAHASRPDTAASGIGWVELCGDRAVAARILVDLQAPRALRRSLLGPPPPAPAEIVSARDLLALGVVPGPSLGALLRAIRARTAGGEWTTREEVLEYVRRAVRSGVKGDPNPDR